MKKKIKILIWVGVVFLILILLFLFLVVFPGIGVPGFRPLISFWLKLFG